MDGHHFLGVPLDFFNAHCLSLTWFSLNFVKSTLTLPFYRLQVNKTKQKNTKKLKLKSVEAKVFLRFLPQYPLYRMCFIFLTTEYPEYIHSLFPLLHGYCQSPISALYNLSSGLFLIAFPPPILNISLLLSTYHPGLITLLFCIQVLQRLFIVCQWSKSYF